MLENKEMSTDEEIVSNEEIEFERDKVGNLKMFNPIEQSTFRNFIEGRKGLIFNEEYIENFRLSKKQLSEFDLTKALLIENKKEGKCIIFNNDAYQGKLGQSKKKDKNGTRRLRYISKFTSLKPTKEGKIKRYFYALDTYDLLSHYYKKNYNEIYHMFNQSNDKYNYNVEELNGLAYDNKDVAKVLGDKINIYNALCDFAKNKESAFSKENGENVFFVSLRYLKETYNIKYSISTLSRVISLFKRIGLISKIKNPTITAVAKHSQGFNRINCYTIKDLREVDILDLFSDVIKENVTYSTLNKKLDNLDTISKVKSIFNDMLGKTGIVAMQTLQTTLTDAGLNASSNIVKRTISELTENGFMIKPTKRIKSKLGLDSSMYVFSINRMIRVESI